MIAGLYGNASEHPRRLLAPGVREETILGYKASGSAAMTEIALVRASRRFHLPGCEPAREHGPGIVGDSGEPGDVHPINLPGFWAWMEGVWK